MPPMLIAMTVMGIMTYSLLLTHPPLMLSMTSDLSSSSVSPHTCSSGDKTSIWRQLPECKPRNTLVKIPFPTNPNVLNVRKYCSLLTGLILISGSSFTTPCINICPFNKGLTTSSWKVVPNQVELARCAGTCHTPDGLYQRCVTYDNIKSVIPVLLKMHARESGQHQCPGHVRDLGAGGGEAGGGLRITQPRGAHQLLLRVSAARVQPQAGEAWAGSKTLSDIIFPAAV